MMIKQTRHTLSYPQGRGHRRTCLMVLVAALFVGIAGLIPSGAALAQTPSTLDTLRLLDVPGVAVGDTFFVDMYVRNVDTLGGLTIRVRFDPNTIEPLSDTIATPTGDSITYEPAFRTGLRAEVFETFQEGVPDVGIFTAVGADFDAIGGGAQLFVAGGSVVARWKWVVKQGAATGSTLLQFENDPVYPASFNVFTDSRGIKLTRPVLIDAAITIVGGGNENAPIIENCPGARSAAPGELVQFSIVASDLDGDNLTLQATNLPVGATFTPSNPVSGNTTVTGTFQWVPGNDQQGVSTVSFQATDATNRTSSFCNVPITVSIVDGNNPPDVTCNASSITVDQGQSVQFTVNASDIDGDSVTLSATNLPSGATLSPGNPISGVGPLTVTFDWTPSFTQSGAFTVTFQALDTGGKVDLCNTTIFVNEVEIDQLFSTSAAGQEPQGGVPGTGGVVIPVNLVNSQASYGVQFDFVYDPTIFTPTQLQVSDRLTGFQVYENLGEDPGRIRVVTFDLDGLQIAGGSSSLLFNIVGTINPGVSPGAYSIFFENAWESISPDPTNPSVPLQTSDGVIMVDNMGDANLDTRIDVGDVVSVIGYILGNYTFDMRQFVAADVAATYSQLDVFDLQGIINLIFGVPLGPAPGRPGTSEPATVQLVYDSDYGAYGAYVITADLPIDVAGAQIELSYDSKNTVFSEPEITAASNGFDVAYRDDGRGNMVMLLIDPDNDSRLPMGRTEVLRLPLTEAGFILPDARLRNVKLAAGDVTRVEVAGLNPVPKDFALFQNYPNPFNPSTTIAFTIGTESGSGSAVNVRLDVFNVLGQRVATLANETLEPGRYEYEWQGTDQSGRPMASGLYFYRLTAGGQTEAKKMVLLK